jgi:hypothetical protein
LLLIHKGSGLKFSGSGSGNVYAYRASTGFSSEFTEPFGSASFLSVVMSIYATYSQVTPVMLDGQPLNVVDWGESLVPLSTVSDKWDEGTCKRVMTVHGYVRTWKIDCLEQDVAWASSLVKYFEEKAGAGIALSFVSTLAVRNVSSKNVKVTSVGFSAADVAAQNLRSFSLELQEVL